MKWISVTTLCIIVYWIFLFKKKQDYFNFCVFMFPGLICIFDLNFKIIVFIFFNNCVKLKKSYLDLLNEHLHQVTFYIFITAFHKTECWQFSNCIISSCMRIHHSDLFSSFYSKRTNLTFIFPVAILSLGCNKPWYFL